MSDSIHQKELLRQLHEHAEHQNPAAAEGLLRASHHLKEWRFRQAAACLQEVLQRVPGDPISTAVLAYIDGVFGGNSLLYRDFSFATSMEFLAQHPDAFRLNMPTLEPTAGAPPLEMFVLPSVSLIGKLAAPLTSEGEIIRDLVPNCPFDSESPYLLTESYTRSAVRLADPALCLTGNWSENFYHFVLEYLPRAIMAPYAGFNGTFLIPNRPFATQWIKLIGIPERRIIVHRGEAVFPERLYVPTFISGLRLGDYPSLLREFRTRVLAGVSQRPEQRGRRVYFSRNRLNVPRRILNEEDVIALLTKFGFEVVYPDALSIEEQVAIVRDAEAFFAPHGAALVFTLFMQPQSLVLEAFPPDYVNPCVLSIARALNHRYYALPTFINPPGTGIGSEVEVSIDLLKMTLERELGGG